MYIKTQISIILQLLTTSIHIWPRLNDSNDRMFCPFPKQQAYTFTIVRPPDAFSNGWADVDCHQF